MNALPSSIEASLEEAGFSATEVIILKRLLEEDAVTLRHIALKTGKSTGVLDQAMKKLLKKGIVTKENINDSPKYVLHSLHSIVQWMEKDMDEKREMMERRHKNFETFIASLAVDKDRPEMEHFEGEDGIKKAYAKLLDDGEEMLVYMPVEYKEEEDPLRDFRVQYFRERRSRGLFQRVIAHDTPLGRRFQSRDMFEYRKTILIKPDACPIEFEQIMIGDTVACIDHHGKKGSFIRYPHLAKSERDFFDTLWNNPNREITIQEVEHRTPSAPEHADLRTRIVSSFREFILSRRSWVALGVFAALSALLTLGLYRYTQELNLQRIKDQVRSIASTAASQFNPQDLAALQQEEDWRKPEWAKVVGQLRDIRVHNESLLFAYIFRRSEESPSGVEFVADSHSLNPFANADDDPSNDVDTNGDGTIDSIDYLQWPGQVYTTAPEEAKKALSLSYASTNDTFYEDHWGRVISGYAPIRDQNETIVAVLAVDVEVGTFRQLNAEVFRPLLFFVLVFGLFILIRFAAFNRSLATEIAKKCCKRPILLGIAFGLSVLILCMQLWGVHRWKEEQRQRGEKLEAVAVTAAAEFHAADLEMIQWARDVGTETYMKLFRKLNEVRNRNPGIKYAYILRPTPEQGIWEFVIDADYQPNIPYLTDQNGDGVVNQEDEKAAPGTAYDVQNSKLFTLGLRQSFHEVITDQWGTYLSAGAPIFDGQGNVVAILGLDNDPATFERNEGSARAFGITASDILLLLKITLSFALIFGLLTVIRFAMTHRPLLSELTATKLTRRNVLLLTFLLVALWGLVYGVRIALFHMKVEEVGERLKVAAATAAREISAEDLAQIHWARDMRSEAYQRVFKQMNGMRTANPEIQYAFILRPLNTSEKMWEFVVDADANYFLPGASDLNLDDALSEADENPTPGEAYFFYSPEGNKYALKQPFMEIDPLPDQWGRFVVASAPIYDANGRAVAQLNFSRELSKIDGGAKSAFVPGIGMSTVWMLLKITGIFVLIFGLCIMVFFVTAHRPLAKEAAGHLLTRKHLVLVGLGLVVLAWITIGIHWYRVEMQRQQVGERLKAIASTAAAEFSTNDIEKIRWARDMRTEEYQRLFTKLNDVRNRNPGIVFAYILRPSLDPEIYEFVADADTNYQLPYYLRDFNEDGVMDHADEQAPPGTSYAVESHVELVKNGLKMPIIDDVYTDQWGTFITGCAPIADRVNVPIAVLCVDVNVFDGF